MTRPAIGLFLAAILMAVICAYASIPPALSISGAQRLHWVNVTCADAAAAAGISISIDGAPVLTTTRSSGTYFWNTNNLTTTHTVSCTTSNGTTTELIGFGATPVPTPTIAPTPVPTVTPSPIPTPTPASTPAILGTTYYVDPAAGSDAANGTTTLTPWQHLSKVKSHGLSPGDGALLKAGSTTNETLDLAGFQGTSGRQIVFSSYGTGAQPILDELNAHSYCMWANPSAGGGTSPVKYVTIDNIHCIHASLSGIKFDVGGGGNFYPGIVVQRSTIEDNGQNCATTTGPCLGTDDGGYNNCLDFQDSNIQADGVQFIGNTVRWCGGHNLVQVHYDIGAVVVRLNTVGPGGPHGYIDCKGCGSPSTPALIESNTLIGGAAAGFDAGAPLLYTEDNAVQSVITYRYNVGYDHKTTMVQFCPGSCNAGKTCQMTAQYYNNTFYAAPSFAGATTAFYASATCNSSCNNPPCTGTLLTSSVDMRNTVLDGGDVNWGAGMGCTEHNNSIGGSQHYHGTLNICGGTATGQFDQINVDPLYTNAGGADFTLQAGSPAINAGQHGLTSINNIGAK